jgi:carbamoyltransferase
VIILGLHGALRSEEQEQRSGFGGHDAAAVLLRDGELVAAVEEERRTRLKHANCFPRRAIQACLEQAGLSSLDQVDYIAFNISQKTLDRHVLMMALADPAFVAARDGRSYLAHRFGEAFDVDVADKLRFCSHHISHAWSALAPSGFDESLVFVADGDGEDLSGLALVGRGRELTTLREYAMA